ncbi:unnamed protein product [Arabis nemorensis]|uniref:Uncharacterized protein n=1 Tax=Arabis nemorensis TaxID=586526 RepID=A0A565ASF3_9BRAS|nr:unnamed protein product [Arabis nemorensis]
MSRYFTTPPPVYARNWANGQNLVESTKQVSDESEQLEKSCLTEENEQQLNQVGYLSDGSQNSKKRRREASPAVESHIKATHVAGNPLRIRFVFKKPKEAEALLPQEDRVCSTSGNERLNETLSSVLGSETSERDGNLPSTSLDGDKIAIPSELKKRKKHKPRKESRYNSLFDEWVPPPCISLEEDDSNSDDWLFGPKKQENASTKASIKKDEDLIMHLKNSEDSIFPRARFLPEVGIFSLPYTVPF